MCRPKTASIDLTVDAGKSHCCLFFFHLAYFFDSFFVTKDENLNPSLLPFMLWENFELVLSKLDAATGEEKST